MIESYTFGNIKINGKQYSSDVIIYPDRVKANWRREQGHSVSVNDIEEIIAYSPEVIIFGKGSPGQMDVPAKIKDYINSKNIGLIIEDTKKACEIFNKLCQTKNAVAALHLTC